VGLVVFGMWFWSIMEWEDCFVGGFGDFSTSLCCSRNDFVFGLFGGNAKENVVDLGFVKLIYCVVVKYLFLLWTLGIFCIEMFFESLGW